MPSKNWHPPRPMRLAAGKPCANSSQKSKGECALSDLDKLMTRYFGLKIAERASMLGDQEEGLKLEREKERALHQLHGLPIPNQTGDEMIHVGDMTINHAPADCLPPGFRPPASTPAPEPPPLPTAQPQAPATLTPLPGINSPDGKQALPVSHPHLTNVISPVIGAAASKLPWLKTAALVASIFGGAGVASTAAPLLLQYLNRPPPAKVEYIQNGLNFILEAVDDDTNDRPAQPPAGFHK